MSVRMIEERKCDRCHVVMVHTFECTIGNLSYMVKRNDSGSMNSDMSLDLCSDCTAGFLAFMESI